MIAVLSAAIVVFSGALFLSPRKNLYLCLLTTTVLSGTILYYGRAESARWLSYVSVMAAFASLILSETLRRLRVTRLLRETQPLFFILLLLFMAFVLLTTLANGVSPLQTAVALKNYAAMWLLAFIVAALPNFGRTFDGLEKGAIALSVAQVPFVAQQAYTYQYVYSPIGDRAPWDAVVGTFGGNPDGGGLSGLLMLFAIVGALAAIHLWQTRRLSAALTAAVVALNVVVLGLAEVKAVFFLLPLALLVQQWRNLPRRPFQVLAILAVSVVTVYILIDVYQRNYLAHDEYYSRLSVAESLSRSLGYFLDPNGINFRTGEVSRGASLMLWWNDAQAGILERLIGYGAGASRTKSTVVIGEVAMRYAPLDISATALAQLLWDTGLIGMSLFVLAMIAAFLRALRLARLARDPTLRSRLQTIAAILCLAPPLLFYDRSLVDMPGGQLPYAVIFGLLLRLSAQADTAMSAAASRRRILTTRPRAQPATQKA